MSISDVMGTIGVPRAGWDMVAGMRGGRRSWSAEGKRQIVEESRRPGASVSVVARRHDLNANLLFTWRRQVGAVAGPEAAEPPAAATPEPAEFVLIGVFGSAKDDGPALVASTVRPRGAGVAEFRPAAPHPALEQRPGVIEIDLPEGVGVRVGSFVNERALSRVLRVLKGRV